MCRFAYLAVAFRGEPPKDAPALVVKHAAAVRRAVTVLSPVPGSTLARFGERCAVVGAFSSAQCACGWGVAEAEGMKRVATSLLRARDVLRVRIGIWWISADMAAADPHASDAPVELALSGLDEADVSGLDRRKSWRLELARSGPPWPTQTLAQLDVSEAP